MKELNKKQLEQVSGGIDGDDPRFAELGHVHNWKIWLAIWNFGK